MLKVNVISSRNNQITNNKIYSSRNDSTSKSGCNSGEMIQHQSTHAKFKEQVNRPAVYIHFYMIQPDRISKTADKMFNDRPVYWVVHDFPLSILSSIFNHEIITVNVLLSQQWYSPSTLFHNQSSLLKCNVKIDLYRDLTFISLDHNSSH